MHLTRLLGSIGFLDRPNQSSEPTTTAVTIPAAQEIAPAAVVARLCNVSQKMKSYFKSIIVLGAVCAAFVQSAFCVTPPTGVAVTYALVPKERLADAVKGKLEALKIERDWRTEMMAQTALPVYPLNLGNQKYSIVIFVENTPAAMVAGKIGLPIQNSRTPVVLNVLLAPGYHGTYVIDGGGLVLTKGIPAEPKQYEWLEVHVE